MLLLPLAALAAAAPPISLPAMHPRPSATPPDGSAWSSDRLRVSDVANKVQTMRSAKERAPSRSTARNKCRTPPHACTNELCQSVRRLTKAFAAAAAPSCRGGARNGSTPRTSTCSVAQRPGNSIVQRWPADGFKEESSRKSILLNLLGPACRRSAATLAHRQACAHNTCVHAQRAPQDWTHASHAPPHELCKQAGGNLHMPGAANRRQDTRPRTPDN